MIVDSGLMRGKIVGLMDASAHLPDSLMPLAVAVSLVHERVYPGHNVANAEEHLSSIATAIAGLVPIYEYGHKPEYTPRLLSGADLSGGLFRDRGRELRFVDGRATKLSLAVRANDVDRVVSILIQARDGRISRA